MRGGIELSTIKQLLLFKPDFGQQIQPKESVFDFLSQVNYCNIFSHSFNVLLIHFTEPCKDKKSEKFCTKHKNKCHESLIYSSCAKTCDKCKDDVNDNGKYICH